MTKKEINERIETLENKIFYLNMKDRWDSRDRMTMDEWKKELTFLKEEL